MASTKVYRAYKSELDKISDTHRLKSDMEQYYEDRYDKAIKEIKTLKNRPERLLISIKSLINKYTHTNSHYVRVEDIVAELEALIK